MTAKQPFVVIRTTGWVLSDRAIREIGVANLQVLARRRRMVMLMMMTMMMVMVMMMMI
jgi:hypothetical protein